MSGIQNVLLISIVSEWWSFRSGLTFPWLFHGSDAEFKQSLAAIDKCAARLLCQGVISATLLDIKYTSSWMEQSYASKEDWPDPEAITERIKKLLGTL